MDNQYQAIQEQLNLLMKSITLVNDHHTKANAELRSIVLLLLDEIASLSSEPRSRIVERIASKLPAESAQTILRVVK